MAKERSEGLTARETIVARGLLGGATTADLAEGLGLSRRTVELHRLHINAKIKSRSPVQTGYLLAKAGLEPLSLDELELGALGRWRG